MRRLQSLCAGVSVLMLLNGAAHAQVIGTYDNFDCFNDTGQETEGFEIDIEDVSCPDSTEGSPTCNLTRVFPSNFGSTPWVIRYGLPSITNYDFTTATADPAHSYDQGHKGVLVTYAATWDATAKAWKASQGAVVTAYSATPAGNGTPYNAKPSLTAGDSCWWYGLGAIYPKSGCDHFGVSFASGVSPGRITYHWKVPDPSAPGTLTNWTLEASVPPSPTFTYAGGAAAPVVAKAEAPENEGPTWGPAYFIKTTTIYQKQAPVLANLQKVNLKKALAVPGTKKYITYSVLQRPPAGAVVEVEKDDVENNVVPAAYVQATKQYEYWSFAGPLDDTGQALCNDAYKTVADYNAGHPIASGDSCHVGGSFYTLDVNDNLVFVKTNAGKYIGAHLNAAQIR